MSGAYLLPAALLAALASGQTAELRSIEPVRPTGSVFLRSYQATAAPAVRLNNSPRFGQLLRAGTLYLTVQDAIALALENNIDLEIARYSPITAAWRLERALSGGLLPGVPSSAGQVGNVASGQGVTGSQAAAGVGGGGGGGGRGSGTNASISQIGPVTQNLDPVFQHASTFSHTTTPQSNVTQSLIYALTADTRVNTSSLQQGFLSGGSLTLSFKENYLKENSPSNVFNPSVAANLSLSFQQSLLRGFGVAVNSRTITVSRMNLKNTDLMFKRSVIAVTAQVLNLYYNLAAALEDVRAKRLAFEAAETLEHNVGRQVELGAVAETELTRVAAQTASAKQALIVAESTLEQQQLRLKNLLSRNGLAEPGLAAAKIHPLDKIQVPPAEELPPVEDMVRQAKQNRVDLALDQENLKASRISAAGTANGVLPTLIAFGGASNAGLAGTPTGSTAAGPGATGNYFVGGFANATGQVFRRNFPTQRGGVFFQAPLGNNQANADQLIDELQLRQSELGVEKRLSQVEVDVRTGVTALRQARARYQAASKNRTLQEQLAQAEERKFELGASTPQAVMLVQRDLAAAQSAAVAALAAYSNARVSLDQTLGQTLEANHVLLDEARSGRVARPSAAPQQ